MSLIHWRPPPEPPRDAFQGRYARLEPLSNDHVPGLRKAQDNADQIWQFLPHGPFSDAEYAAWVNKARLSRDPLFFAVRMADGQLGGTISLLRVTPEAGSIETGWLTFTPRLQQTREATEAVYLLMKWAFEAGYRRFEWKCNAENLASRRAAERFGISYEGIFRQAAIVKGRNRDTAWFAAIDKEWPALRDAFETWLDPSNFDAEARQKIRLSDLTAPILAARDPAV